jgi:Zn-dependent protease
MDGPDSRSSAAPGVRLFRLWSIDVRLDPSVLLVFGLVVMGLGDGLFRAWHPDWSRAQSWGVGAAAALLFFAALLAHEFAHARVAQHFGIRVRGITLFLFGGVAEVARDADTPRAELLIALAGPAASLALAFAFAALAEAGLSEAALKTLAADPLAALAGSAPWISVCLWLASVNLTLALFNLVPGFPLDGGRVLRALVWHRTGDLIKASRVATRAGRWFGWFLMGFGVWRLVSAGDPGGLWYVLIGWFLGHLARASHIELLARQRALQGQAWWFDDRFDPR